jgi:hypothetical protein
LSVSATDSSRGLTQPDLTEDERRLLNRGLFGWRDGSYLTDALAVAMGFENVADFDVQSGRIADALHDRQPLSGWDWVRTLLATEISFASDVMGLGVEWDTITGLDDAASLLVLRGLQRKLAGVAGVLPFGPKGPGVAIRNRWLSLE